MTPRAAVAISLFLGISSAPFLQAQNPSNKSEQGDVRKTKPPSTVPAPSLAELQRALVNLRFGMFIHFSPATFLDLPDRLQPDHAPPRQGKDGIAGTADDLSPALFDPKKLDCGQWADAAKSSGMQFAVLTTKHHDGFCLWPSQYSDYTVAQGCKRDVVREFADAFRKRGLKVGLYYSIRDRTAGIAGGKASPEQIELIKNQLTELLTNYGDILCIVFDGWGNNWHQSPSFSQIPYEVIYNHIKSLQPHCLLLNHSRIRSVTDVPQIELHAGIGLPSGSDWPAVGGDTLQSDWFWRPSYPAAPLRPVDWIVKKHLIPDNARNVVFQLNCAPNRDGLMDDNVVARLAEVGKAWTPPPPLQTIPDSWQNWPTPSTVRLFSGTNIAKGCSVSLAPKQEIQSAGIVVDGNPNTSVDLEGQYAWVEIDLGKVQPLEGIHIWNRTTVGKVMLEQGFIFVSEQPFQSDHPAAIARQPGVKSFSITEPVGYPTPYAVGVPGRYVRIVSTTGKPMGIAEVEIFAEAK